MKNPHRSVVQIIAAIVFIGVAAALAFMAGHPSSLSRLTKSNGFAKFDKFRTRGEENENSNSNAIMRPGRDGGPMAAAEEDYAHRAYPAADVPFSATLNAKRSWDNLRTKARTLSPNLLDVIGSWSLVGPSTANFPAVLTFSGAPYSASGRITALAVDPTCGSLSSFKNSRLGNSPDGTAPCRVWAAAAGGGVWRTTNALDPVPTWTFVSGSFATNAIGTLVYHAASGTLYAGTGEPNASSDSEAGLGVYKSTDGGDTWTFLSSNIGPITTNSPSTGTNGTYTGNAFAGRAISAVVVDPTNFNHIYVASVRSVRGISSVIGGATSNPPTARPPFGLFQSNDGGNTFTFIWDGGDTCPATCDGTNAKATIRGMNDVALDPGWNGTTNRIMYAGAFGPQNVAGSGGIWRSSDGGSTWTQIKSARNTAQNTDRASFAVTLLPNGKTRMYAGVGNASISTANVAHLYRSDDVSTGVPVFTDMTAAELPAGMTSDYCGDPVVGGAQCWYDNVVYSPPGKPDVVYLGGSFTYSSYGHATNGRAFIRSANAGSTFTDMTWDATTNPPPPGSCCQGNPIAPNGMHPDSHAMFEVPGSDVAIFGSDGGLVRTSGTFTDISAQCASVTRANTGANLTLCQQLLSAVPTTLTGINIGLSTLQFQSLSVAADNSAHLMGGTQDNGTFDGNNGSLTWPQVMYGDGGQSGFATGNSTLRFNSFTGAFHDVNFQNGDPTKWVIASGPIAASGETAPFYAAIISDPVAPQTIFQGSGSVWRTQDWAGNQAFLEATCPEFTHAGNDPQCGDFVRIGPVGLTNLTLSSATDFRGTTRAGGTVAFLARTTSDTGTLWVATSTGRVFFSANADNPTAANVTFARIDTLDVNSPARFPSAVYVDPTNPNHAWIAFSGYAFTTPTTPGHIYSVTYNPGGGTATWTNLDGSGAGMFPDFPATAVVADSNGDVYAGNDFGVLRLPSGAVDWEVAGANLPQVEISGLTIVPGARKLYAATHGRSGWKLNLPVAAVSAVSRMTHGGSGTFDIPLVFSGGPSVECRRDGTNNFKIVIHYNNTLSTGNATVSNHNPGGAGGGAGSVTLSGADMIVNLTGVTDGQTLTLALSGVTDVNGTAAPSMNLPIGFLQGDTTNDKLVNSADIGQTKSQSGNAVSASNFRNDVNADGSINSSDVGLVKSKSGNGLP